MLSIREDSEKFNCLRGWEGLKMILFNQNLLDFSNKGFISLKTMVWLIKWIHQSKQRQKISGFFIINAILNFSCNKVWIWEMNQVWCKLTDSIKTKTLYFFFEFWSAEQSLSPLQDAYPLWVSNEAILILESEHIDKVWGFMNVWRSEVFNLRFKSFQDW